MLMDLWLEFEAYETPEARFAHVIDVYKRQNPVMTASGTFGSGAEYSEFVDLKELGAVVTLSLIHI